MSLTITSLLLLLTLLKPTTATCYWPNGNTDNNYTPCPNSKSCCLKGEACLSNGLCYGATLNIAYRGACADKSWPAECPHVCIDTIPDHWANLYSCPNSSTNVFTCGYAGWATDVCSANLGQWKWVSGDVEVAKNGNGDGGLSASASGSMVRDIITTTSSGSGKATGSARGTIAGDIITTTTTGSVTATATGSEKGPGTASPKDSADGSISATTLGAGLGVGLGVPLLVVSGLLIFFMRMRRRALAPAPPATEKVYPHVYYPGPAEIATQRHNMAMELEGSREDRPELYG